MTVNDEYNEGESATSVHFNSIMKELREIKEQVKTTNGRVTSLEKWKYGTLVGLATLAATKWPMLAVLMEYLGK